MPSVRQLVTLTGFDLLQRLRDKSVLIFALVVPLALMFVFNLMLSGVDDTDFEPVTVAVALPADDELAAALIQPLRTIDGIDVTVESTSPQEAAQRVDDGVGDVALVIPEGFGAALAAGSGPTVDATTNDDSGLAVDVVLTVVDAALTRLNSAAGAARAAAEAGLSEPTQAAIAQQVAQATADLGIVEGVAGREQLGTRAALVAGQAGLFLLFTVGFGVLSLVTEREQGTLARLYSLPLRPSLVVASKALSGYVLGVVATGVLLTFGSLFFDVSFGSPAVVAIVVLAAVAAATSLTFVVARLARTAEQANTVQSIIAVVLGIAGGAFFPVAAGGLVGELLDLNPIAALTRSLGITSGGAGLDDLAEPLLILLGFALAGFLLSRLLPDRGALR